MGKLAFCLPGKLYIILTSDSKTCQCRFLKLSNQYIYLQHDNRTIEGYERPCAGLGEVSLTSLTEKLK